MDRLSEIRARCEAFEDSNDSYKGVRPQYILPVLADDGYSRNWAEIAAHSHEDIPYLLARLGKAEAENRWIPVSERLPEDIYGSNREQITVLVCTESKKVSASSRTRLYCWNGADRCLEKTNEFQWNKGKRVTHWRPLPEPPKGV